MELEDMVLQLSNGIDALRNKVEGFTETMIGVSHDVDSLKEKTTDTKDEHIRLWQAIDALKERDSEIEKRAAGDKAKTDWMWKIITTLAIGALTLVVLKQGGN